MGLYENENNLKVALLLTKELGYTTTEVSNIFETTELFVVTCLLQQGYDVVKDINKEGKKALKSLPITDIALVIQTVYQAVKDARKVAEILKVDVIDIDNYVKNYV